MTTDYERVERALRFLDAHFEDQPTLGELAAHLGLSPFHVQRLFKRWAGVSPKRFLQFATVEHAKRQLARDSSLLETSLDAGLSGPGRLHDHFVGLEALTPGEFKRRGGGVTIRHGVASSPFGHAFVALTPRGICRLSFLADLERVEADLARLREQYPEAELISDPATAERVLGEIFAREEWVSGRPALSVVGTNFQIQVWKALLRVPSGHLCSYQALARAVGRPSAARAVGAAIAANPVVFLVPCHRVIRSLGAWGGYRCGTERKRAILAWEAARAQLASGEVPATS